ncbi:Serine/threonine protein kinase [Nannocystis exedens]|uniref:non-specific serine/threonine protein kinase n=1 Tax=Nannocystis exedens TaxID=54 RepID=A0A1I1WIE7_9BACT|nr:serine/threonine-protein kinase [Nannocystis exedens]PCC67619.1 serine/threonine protein kinase [Nannocystis exedens]SFD92880.1 Serine/threonine protein kinase [Nannocystis exedens]
MSNIEPTPFGDKYVLVEHIATGGMAEIYRATYSGIEGFAKELVIKRLREEFAERPNVVRMFLDEARVAATLTHQNVVHTYDLGEIGGEYFIAMELLKGQELVAVLRKSAKTGLHLPLQISLGIIMQALEGLYYVHSRADDRGRLLGLCHRDINPTNIHVGYDGTCKIVDFGIAATRASVQGGGEGQFAGKLAYMAPEQVLGHPIDARADIFALGVVLYEMCLGRRLFRGAAEEVAERIVEGDIPAPTFVDPEFPPALEAIIMKALEVDPAERYQNCDHMFRDLERFTEEAGIRSTPRIISNYMAEMFGEGAPAEVNYDDLYDDLADEALDFDQFDRLDTQPEKDDAPDWAKPAQSDTRSKKSMTIGNLDAVLAEAQRLQQVQQQQAQQQAQAQQKPSTGSSAPTTRSQRAASEAAAVAGARRARKNQSARHKTVPPSAAQSMGSGPRRPPTGANRSLASGRSPLARPNPATSTSSVPVVVDPGATSTTFGHGIMAEQSKRGSAAITWILVLFGLGGLGYVAYTMFSMK